VTELSVDAGRRRRPLLVLVLLASLIAPNVFADTVAAADLTRSMAAARARQNSIERSMRAYDQSYKRVKMARASSKRHAKSLRPRIRQATRGRDSARRHLASTRTLLAQAEAEAAQARGTISALPQPGAVDPELRVRQLRAEVRRAERDLSRLQAQVRRLQRAQRLATRRAALLKRQLRATAARRSGIEGSLAVQIRATTRLAQLRAEKKSEVRPGTDGSGFGMPVKGRISQGYGCTGFRLEPPRGSCRHFHDGIDIVAPMGAPVRASAVGVVAFIGWSPQGTPRAFIVVLGHADGFETLYGHMLPRYPVRVGDVVRRGQVIGYVGNTGRSTGAHVHWEVSRDFVTTNPFAFR
jgi:murein DD-endopeptidase MepM/ murein hydrolase activator NlpD